jgi:hypothetical protein
MSFGAIHGLLPLGLSLALIKYFRIHDEHVGSRADEADADMGRGDGINSYRREPDNPTYHHTIIPKYRHMITLSRDN